MIYKKIILYYIHIHIFFISLKMLNKFYKSQAKHFGRKTKGSTANRITSFPNIYSKTKIIKKKNLPDFSNLNNIYPMRLTFSNYYNKIRYKEQMPPKSDIIDFKLMSGNEILLNLQNSKFLRKEEMLNGFNELSKRKKLPENDFLNKMNYDWMNHEYIKPIYDKLPSIISQLNLKYTYLLIHAFDNFDVKDLNYWSMLEKNIDKHLHQIKIPDFSKILSYFNKTLVEEERNDENEIIKERITRGSKDLFYKIYTILPMNVEKFTINELLIICEVYILQGIRNQRLLDYFIYPKLEEHIVHMNFRHYIRSLLFLINTKYEEDETFWNEKFLPRIYNYGLSYKQADELWKTLMILKVELPSVESSKYIILLEKIRLMFNSDESYKTTINNEKYRLRIDKQTDKIIKVKNIEQIKKEKFKKQNSDVGKILEFDKNKKSVKINMKGNEFESKDKGYLEKMLGLNKKQIDSDKKI